MADKEKHTAKIKSMTDDLCHAGGINAELGGVDPAVDANLQRLSGGP